MRKFVFLFLIFSFFVTPYTYAAKPTPPSFNPKSVCIDAGHGGSDPGTVNSDLLEKNVNLDTALRLESKLVNAGYIVYMTRTNDVSLSNADRYSYCNAQKASILISIHHNGSSDIAIDYTSALYMKKTDQKLASIVSSEISSFLGLPIYGISRFASGVLLKAEMPATISEGFFLTNSEEYSLIKNNERLNQEADALFSSIQKYFNN